ncbi:ectoine/hydroxyectoine ABC transporter substrate-binding protein EhuB [Flexistipes sinusarabici]|uniref:ectoine/hydroxyectoine ABC transporter substrate-binding protein EhuB n=1 Tax=Flexistipes sinusarabici TaxID=2352 RepID=UPI0023552A03|nr:ectoine/hydroxyectoine ABC transporter substrate-binding protein EhuB [Flexistipes sinusarabici]
MFNKFRKLGISFLAVGVFALLTASVASAQVTLQEIKERGYVRVATANEIPYGYVDASGKAMGAGPEVARAVLKRMGIEDIQWVVTSFSSLIPGLKANRFDMAAAEQAILPQRCEQVDYATVPNSSYGEGLLVKAGNPKDIHAYSDFAKREDLKVAIMAGADQLEMLQELGVPQSQMVMIQNNADAISTVATGRADAYAATGLTAANLAKKSDKVELAEPFKDPVINGEEVRSWGSFTFNEGSDDFRLAFSKELKEFKKTDEWRNILEKNGFTPADIKGSFKHTAKELCSGEGI